MGETSSPQDVNFIRHFNTFLNFFLITPWIVFDNKFTWKPKLAKFYGTTLLLSRGLLIFYQSQDKLFVSFYRKGLLSQQIINILTLIVLETLVCSSIAKSAFFDNENWRLLFENFYFLEKHLHGVSEEKKPFQFYLSRFAKHLIFLTLAGYFTWIYSKIFRISILTAVIATPIMYYYYEFLTFCLLSSLVEAFRNRYKYLNKKLLIVLSASELVQEANTFALDYQILSESVQIFNNIFSYKIILIILHCALTVINALDTFYAAVFVYKNKSVVLHLLVGTTCVLCYLLVSITLFRKFCLDSITF